MTGFHGVHTTHHLQFCWSCVVPTPVRLSGCRKPCQVCVRFKDIGTATQPFPWHLSTDFVIVSLRKVEIARLDHSQGPVAPLAFSGSGSARCFGRKWKKIPWALQAGQCPQIWEAWARPSSALLFAFSYPSSWFSALSNITVCVFHDCETAFVLFHSFSKKIGCLSFPLNGSFRSVASASPHSDTSRFLSHTTSYLKIHLAAISATEKTKAKAYCLPRNTEIFICLSW